ncbi:transposon Ty3-G Gag-Pol polyprotein [Trichonephila clavipes]|nr:transposon Ty3-G Gag-Pol polyprotein [Trichonephila clavipes]
MRKDIKNRVRACEKCQRAKVFKHTKAPLSTFALPDARFSHIHIDYIGPYPPSKGYKYCLTIIDSYRIHPASYHPQSNGMIERFHRHLKSAIIAHKDTGWTDILTIVLLGLRSAMKNDLKATSSQLVYGTTLRLPSDLISSESLQTSVTPTYVSKLISMMRKLSPISPDSHSCTKSYAHQSLSTFRNDKIRPPLTPPYTGPHLDKSRSDKNFVICINNKNVTVTIERCKPAFEFSEDFNPQKGSSNFQPPLTKQQIEDKTVVDKNIRTTRSGRHVHFPKRLTY